MTGYQRAIQEESMVYEHKSTTVYPIVGAILAIASTDPAESRVDPPWKRSNQPSAGSSIKEKAIRRCWSART
jgi:hypothetical protein